MKQSHRINLERGTLDQSIIFDVRPPPNKMEILLVTRVVTIMTLLMDHVKLSKSLSNPLLQWTGFA
jgi:hypothetical protein